MDDTKGFLIAAIFLAVCVAFVLFTRRIRKGIDENGIEADAVVSRVLENVDSDTHSVTLDYYARYRTEDGEEIEGLLLNAPRNHTIAVGQRVRIKYHPKFRTNAKLIGPEAEQDKSTFRIL